MTIDKPYENTLSIEELRREVRLLWDREIALNRDLIDLPEVASLEAMRALFHAAMCTHEPDVGSIGKKMQRDHRSAIPLKTEYECAAGLWSLMRAGILAAKEGLNRPEN